jgi:hypothetical protein
MRHQWEPDGSDFYPKFEEADLMRRVYQERFSKLVNKFLLFKV